MYSVRIGQDAGGGRGRQGLVADEGRDKEEEDHQEDENWEKREREKCRKSKIRKRLKEENEEDDGMKEYEDEDKLQ